MNVVLIDSPFANTANIARALATTGAILTVTSEAAEIAAARRLVLPGVGSFRAAMAWLEERGIDRAIRVAVRNGSPLLGICVGHQLLFEASDEHGRTGGLALVRGDVEELKGPLPVPQIGWNRLRGRGPLFEGIEEEFFYFVNSYAVRAAPDETAGAEYNGRFTAAVQVERVFGVQFHPEKSSTAGLRLLRNFIQWN